MDRSTGLRGTAAWVVVSAASGVESRVPLTAVSCLALARLVLADGGAVTGHGVALAREFVRFGGRDGTVVEWLSSLETAAGGERSLSVDPDAARPVETDHDRLLGSLSGDMLVPVADGGMASAADAWGPEAAVLVDAVAAARARRAVEMRFRAAVATARIEALREFAYGAGHELNNPLANIATRAQALLLDEIDPERRRRLAVIVDQAFRGRDMIGGLMVFARPPKPARSRVPIDGVLLPVIEALRPLAAARGVRLQYSPPPAPLDVFVDAAQVTEAVRLLAVNACEAVPAGGRVAIEAAVALRAGVAGCVVTIGDDGPGMDAEVLRRAFDPFFSGREAGRGIGLGLPKAWRLLDVNDGELLLDSRPGKGTRVEILLPMPDESAR